MTSNLTTAPAPPPRNSPALVRGQAQATNTNQIKALRCFMIDYL